MSSLDRNIIEQAYAFFHQKAKVYKYSTSPRMSTPCRLLSMLFCPMGTMPI